MATKYRYNFLVLVFGSVHLISHCMCMHIEAATTAASAAESRKLSDDAVESITQDSNSIGGLKELLKHEKLKEPSFPQFTEPPNYPDPVYVRNPPIMRPVQQLNQGFFPPLSYPAVNGTQFQGQLLVAAPYAPPNYSVSERHKYMGMQRPPPSPQSFQELMHMPLNMENLRGIRSSIMSMVYRVQNFMNYVLSFFSPDNSLVFEGRKKKFKIKKKFKKFLLPLLIAYKLKFFALIPILIGGLVLLVGSTGMAGFFFALFTAVISLKHKN